ncbi:hypothetical protein WJX74_010890 [Apatococcus lobatus]|uniref:Uncharacterized protein n=1 Tax=Apatococcus lobatus TaxID=904363 RepID=A0AAW1RQR4_9CHLO
MSVSTLVTDGALSVLQRRCIHSTINRSNRPLSTCRHQKRLTAAAGRQRSCSPCSYAVPRHQASDSAACKSSSREAGDTSEQQMPWMQGLLTASLMQAAWPGMAEAKDAGQQTLETLGGGIETIQQTPKGGLTPLGLIAVFSPVLLYGVFSIIRTTLNPRLKLSDFYFIAAGGFITINILSIVFFKVRFF